MQLGPTMGQIDENMKKSIDKSSFSYLYICRVCSWNIILIQIEIVVMTISVFSSVRIQLLLVTCQLSTLTIRPWRNQDIAHNAYFLFNIATATILLLCNLSIMWTCILWHMHANYQEELLFFGRITHRMSLYTIISLTLFAFNLWNHPLTFGTYNNRHSLLKYFCNHYA